MAFMDADSIPVYNTFYNKLCSVSSPKSPLLSNTFQLIQRAFLALQERGRAEIEAQSKGKNGGKGAGPKSGADPRPMTAPSVGGSHVVGFNASMLESRGDDGGCASGSPHNSVQSLIQYRDQRLVMDRNSESASDTLMINRSE